MAEPTPAPAPAPVPAPAPAPAAKAAEIAPALNAATAAKLRAQGARWGDVDTQARSRRAAAVARGARGRRSLTSQVAAN
eukprot:CAMPEP_0180645178 /NCGR_PEP_ID=MMETSP1037_2-20121125/48839_1 /TAXON_ID=632150 /ORGANISM="Azadinium spinosum, Strain 3D9" /LENGTH=78 /DNA_ID=CAMNT_0022668995 /DNA_START=13 /DNA_END=249 /DNA_ORIENTATION=+